MDELKNLGRYQIQGVLGKGAMGLVCDGLDPGLNRRVAIKTILVRHLDEESAKMYSRRFEREVRAVARLNHRNIVQVYDFGSEGDLAFIVMEYIQGKELKEYFDAAHRFEPRTPITLPQCAGLRRCLETHAGGQAARGSGRSRREGGGSRAPACRARPRRSVPKASSSSGARSRTAPTSRKSSSTSNNSRTG